MLSIKSICFIKAHIFGLKWFKQVSALHTANGSIQLFGYRYMSTDPSFEISFFGWITDDGVLLEKVLVAQMHS